MADEADSKSVVGNHVWVQVPSPALYLGVCWIPDDVKKTSDLSEVFFDFCTNGTAVRMM